MKTDQQIADELWDAAMRDYPVSLPKAHGINFRGAVSRILSEVRQETSAHCPHCRCICVGCGATSRARKEEQHGK